MKCPNCDNDLVQTKRDDVEVEYCPSCRGLWLSRQELEELEDEVFDFGDDEKGALIFNATDSSRKCPQCSNGFMTLRWISAWMVMAFGWMPMRTKESSI